MAALHLPARRLILAGGFAAVIAIAPTVAVFAGSTADPAPRVVADCTGGESMDAYSLACVPDVAPSSGGAPSESALTACNSDLGQCDSSFYGQGAAPVPNVNTGVQQSP
jgi:hypothetical protein